VVTVPTVVEFPINGGNFKSKSAIVKDSTNEFFHVYTTSKTEEVNSPTITVSTPETGLVGTLYDKNNSTEYEFPFEEGNTNRAYITISTPFMDQDITSSEIRLQLSQNATPPRTVALKAQTEKGGEYKTVIAEKTLQGTTIRFPETTAKNFILELGLTQPLRLREVTLSAEKTIKRTYFLRFLAQPAEQYTVYIDADRSYGSLNKPSPQLQSDRDVFTLQESGYMPSQSNPAYIPADRDGDGIPDSRDNCPNIENPEQADVNFNNVGDECDDFDKDGVMNKNDNCPNDPNRNQRDTDFDGIGDECDVEESRFTEQNPWIPWFAMGIAVCVLVGLLFLSIRGGGLHLKTEEDTEANGEGEGAQEIEEREA
jgi:hypothetical protein